MNGHPPLLSQENLCKIGSIRQLAGIEPIAFREGKSDGVKAFDVRNGRLRYHVLADRGMDIGQVDVNGIPFAWMSSVGYASSAYFESQGTGWLRNFSGGLLTTCGLTQTGEPCRDGQEELGLHGRVSNIPATRVWHKEGWADDRYRMYVGGTLTQTSVFAEHLQLERVISTEYGSNEILVEDTVVNCGFDRTPFMFMYHLNLGFPLVDENSVIVANVASVRSWDGTPDADVENYNVIGAPSNIINEEVFHVDIVPDHRGQCSVMLVNRQKGIGFYVQYDSRQFTHFAMWKGIKKGIYCIGFEPANCGLNGRKKERESSGIEYLAPHESRQFSCKLGFMTSSEEIGTFEASILSRSDS